MLFYKIKNKIKTVSKNYIIYFKYENQKRKTLKIPDNRQISNSIPDLKIAMHFHVFYTDLLDEIFTYVSHIHSDFTLFITVVNNQDYEYVEQFFSKKKYNFSLKVLKVENKGRDIYPFYLALHECYKDFDLIAHFHTKKSLHTDFGDIWRKYLYDNILGSNYLFDNIITYFENHKTAGFLVPPVVPNKKVVEAYYSFKDNEIPYKDKIEIALSKFGIPLDALYASKYNKEFPCGNMFVARTEAIKQFFSTKLNDNDFPKEEGQLTDTLQHYVELMWKYMTDYNNFEYIEILNQ